MSNSFQVPSPARATLVACTGAAIRAAAASAAAIRGLFISLDSGVIRGAPPVAWRVEVVTVEDPRDGSVTCRRARRLFSRRGPRRPSHRHVDQLDQAFAEQLLDGLA